MSSKPTTLGELKAAQYPDFTVKEELERNVLKQLRSGKPLFPQIHGFDETVIPQLTNAVLSHHDIVLLGEKGQAKSRLMRSLVRFLDEEIPIVKGCEIHDHPYHPICASCRRKLAEHGNNLEIEWIGREARYGERLSPGTKIADIIGDLDPAKVAAGNPLASEEAIHFGLIPRMNRGIFAVNELPDLEYLVQVALFNILEERDIQIRGYPIRFNLDTILLFTANPEEYTRAGKIITQLKDRIGAEIRTHYPLTRDLGIKIIQQEAQVPRDGEVKLSVPDFMTDIIEQITMEARKSPYVNQKSGVSARLSIANYETMIANARRRAVILGETEAVPRMSDLNYLYTSSAGKIELDPFREETVTEFQVFGKIMDKAVGQVFKEYMEKDHLDLGAPDMSGEKHVRVSELTPSSDYKKVISQIPEIWEPAHHFTGKNGEAYQASCVEFVLEGLHLSGRLSRTKVGEMMDYQTSGIPKKKGG
ncbi:MAG TPA: magnesium chelatase [bacterium]|nr:magnesium chelatase [bacterium]